MLDVFKKITRIFVKEEPKEEVVQEVENLQEEDTIELVEKAILATNLNLVPSPEIINPEGSKSILFLDDIQHTEILYTGDIRKVKEEYNLEIDRDFKIVMCLGEKAPLIAYKYAVSNNNKIEYGILDITLGCHYNLNGRLVTVDGIDIAILLKRCNPDFKFLLCTAHTLNKTNTVVLRYREKLINHFGFDLESYYLNKNDREPYKIKGLLYENK